MLPSDWTKVWWGHSPHPTTSRYTAKYSIRLKTSLILFRLLWIMSSFSKSWFSKCIRIILKYYFNPISNTPDAEEKTPLEIKLYWIQFLLIKLKKTEDLEHFLLKILQRLKINPSKSWFFYLNMSVGFFSLHAVLFALYYSLFLIYWNCNW